MSLAEIVNLIGIGFSLPILKSKPVFPFEQRVGIANRYVFVVARTQFPSSDTSMAVIGSPRPGRSVLASLPHSLYSLIYPLALPIARPPVSVVAMVLNLGSVLYCLSTACLGLLLILGSRVNIV